MAEVVAEEYEEPPLTLGAPSRELRTLMLEFGRPRCPIRHADAPWRLGLLRHVRTMHRGRARINGVTAPECGRYISGTKVHIIQRGAVRTTTWTLTALAFLATACAKASNASKTGGDSASAPAATAAADTSKGAPGMAGMADSDKAAPGTGVPAGFQAMTDHANASMSTAKYTANAGKWDVQTGPAHILYAAKDSGSGIYAVSAEIDQLEKPKHPEAYGIFFGGQHLDDRAQQTYGYFLVRGTGEFLIKRRNGAKTTSVVDWTANPNVPKEDASGRGTYTLKVHFAKDTAHFLVNDKLVDAVPRNKLPSEGVAGLRINHNLHVLVAPVAIEK